jgi:hypothetical protein
MNRRTLRHNYGKQVATLRRCCLFFALSLLAFTQMSCSEEGMEAYVDTDLLVDFSASLDPEEEGSSLTTRATVDNSWDGNEEVAILMNGSVRKYIASKDGSLKVASGVSPHTWPNKTDAVAISAMSPYQTSLTSFKIETGQQSGGTGLQQSDVIFAYTQASYSNNATQLVFKHLTAKINLLIKADEGVSDADLAGGTLRIVNQSATSGSVSSTGVVTPIKATTTKTQITPTSFQKEGYGRCGRALIVPQTIQGIPFISILAAGITYQYIPSSAMTFQAGYEYTYEVIVGKTGLTIKEAIILPWTGSTDEGNLEEDVAIDKGILNPNTSIDKWTGTEEDETI